jgi:thiamine transport system ATP-binding protein
MIRLEAVRFTYEDLHMHFDLQVGQGEFLAIIGPSGSGKSTLLNLIAGFETPLSGRIALGDVEVTSAAPAKRPVSMVFQDNNSFAHLDVWTNVALGISPSLKFGETDRNRIAMALKRTGLSELEHRKPGEISGGERQRIALARALVREKPILLLDEPFTALGPGLRFEMLDLIADLHREKSLTTLLVSHEPSDARRIATHTAFLEAGKIIAKRPTGELFAAKDLPSLHRYLGTDQAPAAH